jgi:hypothetical protein
MILDRRISDSAADVKRQKFVKASQNDHLLLIGETRKVSICVRLSGICVRKKRQALQKNRMADLSE